MSFEHTWFSATTMARRSWDAAQERYWNMVSMDSMRGTAPENARRAHWDVLVVARDWYRHCVLGWFWRLVAPIKLDECVPDEVAELLAEDWDERTRWRDR